MPTATPVLRMQLMCVTTTVPVAHFIRMILCRTHVPSPHGIASDTNESLEQASETTPAARPRKLSCVMPRYDALLCRARHICRVLRIVDHRWHPPRETIDWAYMSFVSVTLLTGLQKVGLYRADHMKRTCCDVSYLFSLKEQLASVSSEKHACEPYK